MKHTYRLIFNCPDQSGLISEVTGFIASHAGWITESAQHSEQANNWFYSRIEILADSLPFDADELARRFQPIAQKFDMQWSVVDGQVRKKVALFVVGLAPFYNLIGDYYEMGSILVSRAAQQWQPSFAVERWRSDDLFCDISCVIGNHETLRRQVECCDIPFHHVPVDRQDKAPAFGRMLELVQNYRIDTIVLARYMQILPEDFCQHYRNQVINIHHSFLPSFIGAKPYHQAFERGVKLIGATCHYVTRDLDEGPIIEQDIQRVDHSDNIEDLVRIGKDVEKQVLAKGLRNHLEDRIMVDGNKTIIF